MLTPELRRVADKYDQDGTAYAIATVVRAQSPTAGKPGDKAIITDKGELHGWIGGGCAQPAAIKTARLVLQTKTPRLVRVTPSNEILVDDGLVSFHSSCPSGGTLDIFVEPMYTRPVLWVFGSSPVAIKLAALANLAEYDVRVAAPLGEQDMFTSATHFQDSFDIDSQLDVNNSIVIVATQGKKDIPALESALSLKCRFIGFVASDKKAKVYREKLIGRGLCPSKVDAIISPIGKEINAQTPSEIAISILAAVTQFNNRTVDRKTLEQEKELPVKKTDSPLLDRENARALESKGSCCGG